MLSFLAVTAFACGGIDKDQCSSTKAAAYSAWDVYRRQLADTQAAEKLAAATTIRDTYMHEDYSPTAEVALRSSVRTLLGEENDERTATAQHLVDSLAALSDPRLSAAIGASNDVLESCRAEGEPWSLGDRVARSIANRPKRASALQEFVLLSSKTGGDAGAALAARMQAVKQAAEACEEITGPNGPVHVDALGLGVVDSSSLLNSLKPCQKVLQGATIVTVDAGPSLALNACEFQNIGAVDAVFARGDRRFRMHLAGTFALGDNIAFSRGGCSEQPLNVEVARQVIDRFDRTLGSADGSAVEQLHCCDLRPNPSDPACRPELVSRWQPQFRANRAEGSTLGPSWGVWGPNSVDDLKLLGSKSPTVAHVGWTDIQLGRTGMDEDTKEERSITLVRDGDTWKIVGAVGLVDNRSYRVYEEVIPPESDAIKLILDLDSRSTSRKLRQQVSQQCLVSDEERRFEQMRKEVISNVNGLVAAGMRFERQNLHPPNCTTVVPPDSGIADDARESKSSCADELGWSPAGAAKCTYSAQPYHGSVWAKATCDMDDDGVPLDVQGLSSSRASVNSAPGVY